MATVGRNIAAPLLFLNLIMYLIVLGFASWCINKYINGQTNHPSKLSSTSLCLTFDHFDNLVEVVANLSNILIIGFGGNGATPFFLTFSILAAVIGVASKLAGGNHIRFWRNDSLAAAGSASIVAWAVTALAMG